MKQLNEYMENIKEYPSMYSGKLIPPNMFYSSYDHNNRVN